MPGERQSAIDVQMVVQTGLRHRKCSPG
jgi:hypothetical protein